MPECNLQKHKSWPQSSRLAAGKKVVRVYKWTKKNFDPRGDVPGDLFNLNGGDWNEADAREMQPLASTWEHGMESADLREARKLGEGDAGAVYVAEVDAIHELSPDGARVPLEFHADPLPSSEKFSNMHSGLQGLYKEAFASTVEFKEIRRRVLSKCTAQSLLI